MQKLCHILAVEKQVKTQTAEKLNAIYHAIQKESLLNGISRTYKPTDDDGEKFPAEKSEVQLRVTDVLRDLCEAVTPVYDVIAARDLSNCSARADVEIDGKVLLRDVPAVTLLYLEKELVSLLTIFNKLPELPQTESWKYDENTDTQRTEPVETGKTKKIAKPFVKYPHSDKHPAQVDVVTEDVLVGYWTTTKFSGAISRERKRELKDRASALLAAVKVARETANQAEAKKVSVAKEVFGFLLAP